MKAARTLSFRDYIKEILKNARYKKGRDIDCVVAIAPDLPGCITQGDNFEEARENLIDAIQLWITTALQDGEYTPSVNGYHFAGARPKKSRARMVHA